MSFFSEMAKKNVEKVGKFDQNDEIKSFSKQTESTGLNSSQQQTTALNSTQTAHKQRTTALDSFTSNQKRWLRLHLTASRVDAT